MDLKLMT